MTFSACVIYAEQLSEFKGRAAQLSLSLSVFSLCLFSSCVTKHRTKRTAMYLYCLQSHHTRLSIFLFVPLPLPSFNMKGLPKDFELLNFEGGNKKDTNPFFMYQSFRSKFSLS